MFRWFLRLPRHLRIAIMVAPILAIGGFGLADLWMRPETVETEKQDVAMFQLLVQGQCTLSAAQCTLSDEANELKLAATPASSDTLLRFDIQGKQLIRGLQMAIVQDGKEEHLVGQETGQGDHWYVEFPREIVKTPDFTLRMVVAQTKKLLIAEFPARL
ncbi:MAG: hypothetical protein R3E89_07870 [Thiolinea sp.]